MHDFADAECIKIIGTPKPLTGVRYSRLLVHGMCVDLVRPSVEATTREITIKGSPGKKESENYIPLNAREIRCSLPESED